MKPEERLQLFQNMADADPDNELAHFSLGKLRCEAGEFAEAEPSLRRALEINPQHSVAHSLLGEALIGQDKKDEAIALLEEGVRLAHERGEFMPRDKMRSLLESLGATPPDLTTSSVEDGGPVDPNAWTCKRCFKANTQLDETPFSSELGQSIHESICDACWQEWIAMSIKVINEYRLNMALPEANEIYDTHMKEFLGL
jgi:Fe-S cluster biosynthesis and repair protein YggX